MDRRSRAGVGGRAARDARLTSIGWLRLTCDDLGPVDRPIAAAIAIAGSPNVSHGARSTDQHVELPAAVRERSARERSARRRCGKLAA